MAETGDEQDILPPRKRLSRRRLIKLAAGALAGMALGCNSPVEQETPAPKPTQGPTRSSEPPTPIIPELFDPQVRAGAIRATAEAVKQKGWEQLKKEGFSETAINSSVCLVVKFLDGIKKLASGSVMLFNKEGKDYWVIITAGHYCDVLRGEIMAGNKISEFVLSRNNLPTESGEKQCFVQSNIALSYIYNESDEPDLGVIVISGENKELDKILKRDRILKNSQLYFLPPDNSKTFSAIGFPVLSSELGELTVCQDGVRNSSLSGFSEKLLVIDQSLVSHGFSGAGFFANDQYVGVGVRIFEEKYPTNTIVFPLSALGEKSFWGLVNGAIDKLKPN